MGKANQKMMMKASLKTVHTHFPELLQIFYRLSSTFADYYLFVAPILKFIIGVIRF